MAKHFINSTHECLSNQTADLHDRLDKLLIFKQLLDSKLTVEEYVNTLSIMQAWFRPIEVYLDNALRNLGDISAPILEYRKNKAKMIEDDLAQFNNTPQASPFSTPIKLSEQDTPFALGVLYVVEGSTLGGMVIAPKLQQTLNIRKGLSFYKCYENRKFKFFSSTIGFIHENIHSKATKKRLVEGAQFAFKSLHDHTKAYQKQRDIADA